MIYLDTSVALAEVFGEQRRAPEWVWQEKLISSRLLQYELRVRIHARNAGRLALEAADDLLTGMDLVELSPPALERALLPFPVPVRALDALHLATVEFLRGRGNEVRLLSFDGRLNDGARALGIACVE